MPRTNVTDRDSLVRTAADLVGARGVAGTRLVDVAGAVGVSVGTVYNYFPSKDDLLDAVAHRLEADFVTAMSGAAPPDVALREAVPDLVRAVLILAARSPSLRVLSERAGTRPGSEAEAAQLRAWIAQRVDLAQLAGELAPVDAQLVADLGFALLRAAMTRRPADGESSSATRESTQALLVAALLGLLPPRRPAR